MFAIWTVNTHKGRSVFAVSQQFEPWDVCFYIRRADFWGFFLTWKLFDVMNKKHSALFIRFMWPSLSHCSILCQVWQALYFSILSSLRFFILASRSVTPPWSRLLLSVLLGLEIVSFNNSFVTLCLFVLQKSQLWSGIVKIWCTHDLNVCPPHSPTPAIRVWFKGMHFDVFLYLCAKYGAHSRPEEAASQRPQREEVVNRWVNKKLDFASRSLLFLSCFLPASTHSWQWP